MFFSYALVSKFEICQMEKIIKNNFPRKLSSNLIVLDTRTCYSNTSTSFNQFNRRPCLICIAFLFSQNITVTILTPNGVLTIITLKVDLTNQSNYTKIPPRFTTELFYNRFSFFRI